MNENEILKLRGHHLGAIYTIVSIMELRLGMVQQQFRLEVAMQRYFNQIYNHLYPAVMVNAVKDMMKKIFATDQKIQILIVNGPDDICDSGCIQESEEISFGNYVLRQLIFKVCNNATLDLDVMMLEIFDCEIGKIYSAEKIIQTACILANQHRVDTWGALDSRLTESIHEVYNSVYNEKG